MVDKALVRMAAREAEIRSRGVLRSFHRRAFPPWHIDLAVAAGQKTTPMHL